MKHIKLFEDWREDRPKTRTADEIALYLEEFRPGSAALERQAAIIRASGEEFVLKHMSISMLFYIDPDLEEYVARHGSAQAESNLKPIVIFRDEVVAGQASVATRWARRERKVWAWVSDSSSHSILNFL